MSDKFYVGLDLTGCADNGKRLPVTSVTLQADGERTVTAGTYTGLDLYAVCPYATQEMAAAILVQAQGYQYQAFSMDSANLDPAAELGDGIDGGGLYGVISSIRDAGDGYPTISAPGVTSVWNGNIKSCVLLVAGVWLGSGTKKRRSFRPACTHQTAPANRAASRRNR